MRKELTQAKQQTKKPVNVNDTLVEKITSLESNFDYNHLDFNE